jgi:hypothetical protein
MLCNYIDGDFDKAREWLNAIEEIETVSHFCISRFDRWDQKRFYTIQRALKKNIYSSWKIPILTARKAVSEKMIQGISLEKDLVSELNRNENLFRQIFGKSFRISCTELETAYGNVDIVAYTDLYAWPIEVKLGCADHRIVGQIYKYMKHFLYMLNYGLYRDVVGITIAREYSEDALQELSKMNVVPIKYSVHNGLCLQRV